MLILDIVFILAVIESQNSRTCPWSALNCSDSGMTWSMLVYVEDQNLADQTQILVYSKDTAAFYITTEGM